MGARGPLPKTAAQHLLAGNPRHLAKALLVDERPLPAYAGEAPVHLSDDERAIWWELATRMHSASQLAEIDLPAFEMLAVEWARWKRCEAHLRELRDDDSQADLSGMLQGSRDAGKVALVLFEKFGMTPNGRARTPQRGIQKSIALQAKGKIAPSEPASFQDFL